ncbi:uncharacterized protein LOC105845224 isoform X2 [Hydra vulgaris]|uniref:uncharacterized protein LOC105845224 isoform X2 n=1 Tax=Hydra vulgaris TaxID=6087 RepID=UPI001F5E6FFA|nr:uncharacterized protein LOC105845224 isoform X2 [Hydra vulgaris]
MLVLYLTVAFIGSLSFAHPVKQDDYYPVKENSVTGSITTKAATEGKKTSQPTTHSLVVTEKKKTAQPYSPVTKKKKIQHHSNPYSLGHKNAGHVPSHSPVTGKKNTSQTHSTAHLVVTKQKKKLQTLSTKSAPVVTEKKEKLQSLSTNSAPVVTEKKEAGQSQSTTHLPATKEIKPESPKAPIVAYN